MPTSRTSSAGTSARKRLGMFCDGAAPQRPAPGVRQVQVPPGPGDAHVTEPTLLLELARLAQRPEVGEDPVFQPDQEHRRELEPLGSVQGHRARPGSPRRPSRRSPTPGPPSRGTRDRSSYSAATPTSSAMFSMRPSASWLRSATSSARYPVRSATSSTSSPGGRRCRSAPAARPVGRRALRPPAAALPVRPASSAGPRASPKLRALGGRPRRQPGHRGVADAALGHVHDPTGRDLVGRVGQQSQVGQHVLDLAPVVEAGAADHLVGHARPGPAPPPRTRLWALVR